jgi:hypothetical protein
MKEKWVSKRGLITALKGKEERGGGAIEETKKRKKAGLRKEGSFSGMRAR